MPDGDWLDDYMDYKLSSGDTSDDEPSGTSSAGCLPTILVVLAVLWVIGKLF